MNENQKTNEKADAKAQETSAKIEAKGPTDKTSNSEILRFHRDKGNKMIDIRTGQILTVGEDITQAEADRLLNLKIWNFKEVKE